MSSYNFYYCPQCGSPYILISKFNIYCPLCGLSYNKKQIDRISEDNLLTKDELEGIIDVLKTMNKNKLKPLEKLKS